MLARANKERLAVLLDEVKGRSNTSDERYAAALRYLGVSVWQLWLTMTWSTRGESLGTHSSGSSRDAVVRVQ